MELNEYIQIMFLLNNVLYLVIPHTRLLLASQMYVKTG